MVNSVNWNSGEDKVKKRHKSGVNLTRPFSFSQECNNQDPLFTVIMEKDLKGLDSPLELMKHYADILNKQSYHGDISRKLDLLFSCGKVPMNLDGYYHGITISLKTGTDTFKVLDEIRKTLNFGDEFDPLQVFYGRLLSSKSPWAGKSFKKLSPQKLKRFTDGFDFGQKTAYLGINAFRKAKKDVLNNIANSVLSLIIEMESLPDCSQRQRSRLYARGGLFVAYRQKSVNPDDPEKEVLALNYRWKHLGNRFPNRLLIDEIVEIAEGLFLGKLYYATALNYVTREYDPDVADSDYKYRNFGYFLLMNDSWLHEKNVLFPEMAYQMTDNLPEKFGTFRLIDTPESRKLQAKVTSGKTVLHYLQELSERIKQSKSTEDECFQEIHRLFMMGQRPDGIQGFFHGAVVCFKRAGFLKIFEKNLLNAMWPAVRPFSPWTGKTFTDSTVEDIREYIADNADHYKNKDPIILGTNTYRKELDLSLPASAFVRHLNKIGMVVEKPDENEKQKGIYIKSFFFIAANSESVNPECSGKEVLQFNYRWPEFHTMPPDHLCIDELVRIADGLYMGQLLYATKHKIPFDPNQNPVVYGYENFGFFLLMDDDWYAIKEFILFDM
jgi:hypothetical protein